MTGLRPIVILSAAKDLLLAAERLIVNPARRHAMAPLSLHALPSYAPNAP